MAGFVAKKNGGPLEPQGIPGNYSLPTPLSTLESEYRDAIDLRAYSTAAAAAAPAGTPRLASLIGNFTVERTLSAEQGFRVLPRYLSERIIGGERGDGPHDPAVGSSCRGREGIEGLQA